MARPLTRLAHKNTGSACRNCAKRDAYSGTTVAPLWCMSVWTRPDARAFRDRHDAGIALAGLLQGYSRRNDVVVLALPRGGVPVAHEVALALHLPLDVFSVRKLGVRHDVVAIEVVDPRELELPDVGVLTLMDPETGALHEVQTADPALRQRYADAAGAQRADIARALRAAGAAHLRLRTDSDWLLDMVRFVAAQRHARTRGTTR